MMLRRSLVTVALGATVASAALMPAQAGITDLVVHADQIGDPSNQALIGFGWNDGWVAGLDAVGPLAPRTIRIDARLTDASQGPDDLDLSRLLADVAAVRAIGAEPQVILSYMPLWLGEPYAYGRDPSRVAPFDYDAWQHLIETVVRTVATAEAPALRFEVWNEPDIPIFFQDSPSAFIDMVLRTHRAVADVATETGLPLEVGGPAAFFADPIYIESYVRAVADAGLPLDFVSWHHYGNTPFLGPDGAEDLLPPYIMPLYPIAGRRNPATTPLAYSAQVEVVRAAVAAALVDHPDYDPELVLDEWNLSAGGYDLRHESHEGAAFVAATLTELEASGIDGADFYRSSGSATPGDWGLVAPDGDGGTRVKPAWHVFDAWRRTAGDRLPVDGALGVDGLLARATRHGDTVDVLVSSFVATGGRDRTVDVRLDGCSASEASVASLDATSSDFSSSATVAVVDGRVHLEVSAQSVQWIRASCTGG